MPPIARPRRPEQRVETAQALYTPLPKQIIAHTCPADEMLYGGAAGGGKSAFVANDAVVSAARIPGIRCLILRRYTTDLQEQIDYMQTIMPEPWANWNENKKRWVFNEKAPDGRKSVIQFSHLVHEADAYRHKSLQWDRIYFDEETTFTHFQRMYLRSRNRSTVPGSRAVIRGASNPGDIGHQDVKDYFVRPPDAERVELVAFYNFGDQRWERFPPGTRGRPEPYIVWRPDESDDFREMNARRVQNGLDPLPRRSRCFIPATLFDNPYLADTDYQSNLYELRPDERRALEMGDWDAFEGSFFKDFNANTHVVHEFQIKAHWRKWRSLDWGLAEPLSCHWHAYDPDNEQVVTYREFYEIGLTDSEAIKQIIAMTPRGEHIDFTEADPSMWRGSSRDDALSTAEIYAKGGLPLRKANNARLAGWARMLDVLKVNPRTQQPGWVISSDCSNLIRELRGAVADKKSAGDIVAQNDHALDECRYALLATPAFFGAYTRPVKAGKWR